MMNKTIQLIYFLNEVECKLRKIEIHHKKHQITYPNDELTISLHVSYVFVHYFNQVESYILKQIYFQKPLI